jgi:hypothetical protein
MEKLAENNFTPEQVSFRLKILQYKVWEQQVGHVWRLFEEAGFSPIIIKGWAAAQFYPEPNQRDFVDIDLMVLPEKFDAANRFLEDQKLTIPVDLHAGARHLDLLSFEDISANSVLIKCGQSSVRVPAPEDHLRILCVHWLTDGGANREKLWDIYYVIANRTENFDWNRLLNPVGDKRRRWIECTVGLAHKYLGLDIENTPVEKGAKNLPEWLVSAIEKEWASEVKTLPLDFFLNDKKMFWKQIKKRLPPNPIQATVLSEGDFDRHPRLWYQLKTALDRVGPSIKRIRKSKR